MSETNTIAIAAGTAKRTRNSHTSNQRFPDTCSSSIVDRLPSPQPASSAMSTPPAGIMKFDTM